MTDQVSASGVTTPQPTQSASKPASSPENTSKTEQSQEVVPDFKKYKHKLKVDKGELELDYDELIARAQKATAADKRMQHGTELAKRANSIIDSFRSNPKEAFKQLNAAPDVVRQFCEEYLLEHIEYENLSKEEKLYRAEKQRADSAEERLRQRDAESERAKFQQNKQEANQVIFAEIGEALKSINRVPTPRLIARVAETLYAQLEVAVKELEAEYGKNVPEEAYLKRKPTAMSVVKSVDQETLKDVTEVLGSLPLEVILQVLPKSVLDGLRQAEVNKVLAQDPAGSRKVSKPSAPRPEKNRRVSMDDAFKEMEKRFSKRA